MNTVSTATLGSQNTTGRKIISIVQIILLVAISILPFVDGMFTWYVNEWFDSSYHNELSMSLSILMTVQEIGAGPIAFWAFMILLAGMVAYCVLQIFKEFPFTKKTVTSVLPAVMLVLGGLMVFSAGAHTDTFEHRGNTRFVSVSPEIMAYIFLVLLAAVLVLELYKQIKMNN